MKKIKRLLKDNTGFTLVEMIIVIAIIVIMTGASFITLSIIRSARAKDAASSFETDLAYVISNAKNKDVDYDLDGTVDKGYSMGLRLYASGNKVYLQRCLLQNGNYVDLAASNPYIQSVNVGNGMGTSMSAYVDIIYTDADTNSSVKISGSDEVYLAFNKKGECINGAGTYTFKRKESNDDEESTVVTVRVNKNGSYHVK